MNLYQAVVFYLLSNLCVLDTFHSFITDQELHVNDHLLICSSQKF